MTIYSTRTSLLPRLLTASNQEAHLWPLINGRQKYNLFIAHHWNSAHKQVEAIMPLLRQLVPRIQLFVDVDQVGQVQQRLDDEMEASQALMLLCVGRPRPLDLWALPSVNLCVVPCPVLRRLLSLTRWLEDRNSRLQCVSRLFPGLASAGHVDVRP